MHRRTVWSVTMLGLLVAVLPVRSALASSVWMRAHAAQRTKQNALFERVENLYSVSTVARRARSESRGRLLKLLREQLQRAGVPNTGDLRLVHLLARIEYDLHEVSGDATMLKAAMKGFSRVAQHSPSQLERASAYNALAVCLARMGAHGREVSVYAETLRYEPHNETRAMILANMAEGDMARGRLTKAIRGYRSSLLQTPPMARHRIAATTHWGLAVALDRDGDLNAALREVSMARGYDPKDEQLQGPNWFFVPKEDAHWYAALGHWAHARAATSEKSRVQEYQKAQAEWTRYIEKSKPTIQWLSVARKRLKQCTEEQQRRATAKSNDAPRH